MIQPYWPARATRQGSSLFAKTRTGQPWTREIAHCLHSLETGLQYPCLVPPDNSARGYDRHMSCPNTRLITIAKETKEWV